MQTSMNPLLVEALGAILRWALTLGAGWLVERGIWTSEASAIYVAALATAILTLAWTIWQKVRMRSKLLVALGLAGVSESAVQAIVADPTIPNPPVTHPKDRVPTLSQSPVNP